MYRFGFIVAAVIAGLEPAGAQQVCDIPNVGADGSFEYVFRDRNGQPATAWRVRAGVSADAGLYIDSAEFRTSPGADWIEVLSDARVAEIFVPYHSGHPRFYDTNYFSLVPLSQDDVGACGAVPAADPYMAIELRDHGVLWKQYSRVFRSRDVLLWSAMGAGNYNYLISYSFGADGTIELRAAGTAQNLPSAPLEAHTHTVRIDVDLAGADHDTLYVLKHVEQPGHLDATDLLETPNGGREAAIDFQDLEFSELRIEDPTLNGLGHPISYDIRPVRRGAARHFGSGEEFAQHDAWVLSAKSNETLADALPSYANTEPVQDKDIVVWVQTPLHHEPRDEEGYYRNGQWYGVALAMWGGLDLRPRNIFSGTPHYP
jgi:primary-amine oxidase